MHEQCACEKVGNDTKLSKVPEGSLDNQQVIPPITSPDLDQCRQEMLQWKERCVRITADFENYKRRNEREQASWIRSSKMAVLRNLLGVIDDIERALADCAKRQRTPDNDSLISGVEMMGASFHKFLETADVTEITDLVTFDPLLHEAIAHVDAPEYDSGSIVEVFQKGYLFSDQVLRPAKVGVAK